MTITAVERRLLALHYLFPVPKNRLNTLFEEDPDLTDFHLYSAHQLAHLLNISVEKAGKLKAKLTMSLITPYETVYEKYNITPIPFTDRRYPKCLLSLIDPPTVLYTRGDGTLLAEERKVAVIGSRRATAYSRQALKQIVPPLVQHGVPVVSGLAKGADTMAHESALAYGGRTIAVLGHGLFHLYPKMNERLATDIGKTDLLITEYPPYVKPARWTFPMRNRIISGLADAVVVTEAATKSGTMSTIEHALDHGKAIYAVPGPITSELSEGPHKLIDEGAQPLWNGFQIIEALPED